MIVLDSRRPELKKMARFARFAVSRLACDDEEEAWVKAKLLRVTVWSGTVGDDRGMHGADGGRSWTPVACPRASPSQHVCDTSEQRGGQGGPMGHGLGSSLGFVRRRFERTAAAVRWLGLEFPSFSWARARERESDRERGGGGRDADASRGSYPYKEEEAGGGSAGGRCRTTLPSGRGRRRKK